MKTHMTTTDDNNVVFSNRAYFDNNEQTMEQLQLLFKICYHKGVGRRKENLFLTACVCKEKAMNWTAAVLLLLHCCCHPHRRYHLDNDFFVAPRLANEQHEHRQWCDDQVVEWY
jgi:hypothetical protein